jgi:purine-cytosine permease-like protein
MKGCLNQFGDIIPIVVILLLMVACIGFNFLTTDARARLCMQRYERDYVTCFLASLETPSGESR